MARSVELIGSDAVRFRETAGQQVPGGHDSRTAISVELTDPEHVASSVEPGSWVAIFVSEDPEPHLAGASARKLPPLTRILLPKVQVLGVVEPTDHVSGPMNPTARISLTIAVTQTEAEKVTCGSRNGDLTFAVRSDKVQVAERAGTTGCAIAPVLYGSAS